MKINNERAVLLYKHWAFTSFYIILYQSHDFFSSFVYKRMINWYYPNLKFSKFAIDMVCQKVKHTSIIFKPLNTYCFIY